MRETALFSGKIYTADKNFTRPPVATVATNSKSESAIYQNGAPISMSEYIFLEIGERHTTFGLKQKQV